MVNWSLHRAVTPWDINVNFCGLFHETTPTYVDINELSSGLGPQWRTVEN